ncbi:MAG TPA: MEDS domain-containing protein [Candidatus Dormibacteraeota bacterium]|nr:MEDS domain-containing protein [Candidatus Dormibacteraeota bacterium]
MSDKLLTTREAARFLRASEASLRRWADAGLLPASRLGRRRARRFKEDDLLRFMGPDQGGPSPATTGLLRPVALEGMFVGLGSHLGSFYSTDAGRLRLGLPFLRDGIRSGQPCVLFALPDVRAQYVRALQAESVDVEDAERTGLLTMLSVTAVSPEEFIARLEGVFIDITRRRPGPFRFLGEPVAGVAAVQTVEAFLRFEHQCGALTKRFPMVMLCAYDVREFDALTILECLKLHHDTFAYEPRYFLS